MQKELERTERLEQQRRERELKHQLQIDVSVGQHFKPYKSKEVINFPSQARRKRDEEAAKLKQEELQRKQQEKELKRQQQMFIKEQVCQILTVFRTFH